jgi:hypothetical protein
MSCRDLSAKEMKGSSCSLATWPYVTLKITEPALLKRKVRITRLSESIIENCYVQSDMIC